MKTTILILLGISLLFFSTVLFLLADEQQNNNKPHILNVPNKHTKEIVQDEIKTCIKVLNGELPPTSYDGGKSQCVIDLVHLNADPKIVYPIFLNCLKNDKDEDAKKEIVVSILRFNKGQEVRKLLLQIANKKIDKGQKYIQGTIQNEAALELV